MHHVWVFLLFCFAVSAFAQQDNPRAEVFGGYSYLHIDTQGVTGASLDTVCNNLLGAGFCPAGTFQVHPDFNGWETVRSDTAMPSLSSSPWTRGARQSGLARTRVWTSSRIGLPILGRPGVFPVLFDNSVQCFAKRCRCQPTTVSG